jgi:GNAT superfamily N-acetyltransferase
MTEFAPNLERWWDWYAQPLSLARAAGEWTWIERIANETRSNNPVISAQVAFEDSLTAGFCLLLAGALAVQGGITRRPHHRSYRFSDLCLQSNSPDTIPRCIERLIVESFKRKAELYQALLPAESAMVDPHCISQDHCRLAGMFYLTKLNRMEKSLTKGKLELAPGKRPSNLTIQPYHRIPEGDWIKVIEDSYVNSKDVPEISSLRSTRCALEGYRANRTRGVEGWFVVRVDGKPAGCLILARNYHPVGEISYLGLSPEFRGKGYSFGIMQFALDWMASQRCTKVALALDSRNEVALRVYQNWGFQDTISYHAWVASPKTFQSSDFYSST